MRIKLPFSYFPVFIGTDSPTRAFEQKSGQSGDANQTCCKRRLTMLNHENMVYITGG